MNGSVDGLRFWCLKIIYIIESGRKHVLESIKTVWDAYLSLRIHLWKLWKNYSWWRVIFIPDFFILKHVVKCYDYFYTLASILILKCIADRIYIAYYIKLCCIIERKVPICFGMSHFHSWWIIEIYSLSE